MKFLVDILRPQQDEGVYTSVHVCNIGCMRNCLTRLAQVYLVRGLEILFTFAAFISAPLFSSKNSTR